MVPLEARALAGTLAITTDCFTMIWATIYFMFLSHYSIYWEYTAVFINIASMSLIAMYCPESPKWLYEKGRFKDAKEALIYIARNNGVDIQALENN